jgi:molybdopterin/thiamine biosynthesis adenylyltransferase
MKRIAGNEPSSLGHEATIRMTRVAAEALYAHMRQDDCKEQMAFGLASQAKTAEGTLFLVNELVLPDNSDLAEQSIVGICPTKECQNYVYFRAQQTGKSIVEFHTHPGGGVPHFSGVDETHGYPNAEYISAKFQEPTTLLMVVGNNRFDAFDGIAFDRHRHMFRQIDRFEVLGRPNDIQYMGGLTSESRYKDDAAFDRQQKIPGWNQLGLERQRIGIFGAGGNGSPLFQRLLGIGAGRQGFLAIADHDCVEPSNLPRIPYAYAEHVGVPKVSVAVQYAGRKSPGTPVFAFPCRFNEGPVLDRMKTATVLFYCGDSDGGRKEVNDFAVCYGIPLIEMGCDIQVSPSQVAAGGQIRLVLPGQNACLVCCRGYDPAQAAIDQMDDIDRTRHAAQGYVLGAEGLATPSVANLNGMTVQFAVSQFLALVNGGSFAEWDYLHFDQSTGKTIPATTTRQDGCPLCGQKGSLAAGDKLKERTSSRRALVKLESVSQNQTSRQRRRPVSRKTLKRD